MKIQMIKAIMIILLFIVIQIFIVIYGKNLMNMGDEMLYSILFFYIITPSLAFTGSFFIGKMQIKLKWIAPLIFGGAAMFPQHIVFGTRLRFEYGRLALVFAIIGLLSGVFLIQKKR